MSKDVFKMYKDSPSVKVYRPLENSNMVYKEYTESNIEIELEMKKLRFIAMMNREKWPHFLSKPVSIEEKDKSSFIAMFPFIEGEDLYDYLIKNDVDLLTCANIIKKLEDLIYKEGDFVFPDIANPANIIITPNATSKSIDLSVIDVDEVQFDTYHLSGISRFVGPVRQPHQAFGLIKCMSGYKFNKQLDIRSMYSLIYSIINGDEPLYAPSRERSSLSEYEKILKEFNIPENSSLYENTMSTLSEEKENLSVGDSLFELIEKGYEFDTIGVNYKGYKHVLVRK